MLARQNLEVFIIMYLVELILILTNCAALVSHIHIQANLVNVIVEHSLNLLNFYLAKIYHHMVVILFFGYHFKFNFCPSSVFIHLCYKAWYHY